MKKHIDLFSGIGGFALATEMVWDNVEHIFVEYDPFCQSVLKKHWSQSEIHGDIREFIANAKRERELQSKRVEQEIGERSCDILTGGFPCQPFSHAGRRKGTADDRYLWEPMRDAISLFKPRWIIAENVAGLASWNDGVVLETVCSDLEKEGYEVQPFVVPACAVGAPHRRDRIWIVAHSQHQQERDQKRSGDDERAPVGTARPDTAPSDSERAGYAGEEHKTGQSSRHHRGTQSPGWSTNWIEVATRLCRVDDGIPRRMDRNSRLKALGNAVVPQVAAEIMRAIMI